MKKVLTTIALLASPLFALAATPNLVVNGSFEDNALANGAWSNFSNINGWTGVGAGIEVRNNVAGSAFDGLNYVELDTTKNSSMFQTIATQAGQSYNFSFAYANRPGTAVATNGLDFTVDGGTTWTALAALPAATTNNNWTTFSTSFVAGASTTIGFRATGTSDTLGSSLDKVSLTAAVPEPQTYALMLAGLGALGFVARRRNRQQA